MKYVIYGLGISGISAAKFLAKSGFEVIATDDNENSLKNQKIEGVNFLPVAEINFDEKTIISFAPGIPLHYPQPHKILEITQKTGAKLVCDIEIFYQLNQNNNFIAVTGTNGKSTTTALTGFIFQNLGIPAEIGGNIGVPCFDLPQKQNNFSYIFETSSFQLDLISKSHFQIAALLNITPDHIDRHGSIENYIKAKKAIFRNQIAGDFALIDVDNHNSKSVFEDLIKDENFQATIIGISTKRLAKNPNENLISLINSKLTCQIFGQNFSLNLESEFLRGEHNDQNMAFAFAITHCFAKKNSIKISPEKIIATITKFKGLRHRLQLVGEKYGIKFINDSKATNAESSENALKAYEQIFWILGGKAKDGGIKILEPYFSKITKAYLIGAASDEFAKFLAEKKVDFVKCENLDNAFKMAVSDAKNSNLIQKNILLSPACASFDQWKNFEQRGDYFCKLFDEL